MKYILCVLFMVSSISAAMAQSSIADQKAMQAQFMRDVNSNRSSSGGGGRSNNNTISSAERARRQRVAEATAANEKGVDFYKNQDWADAAAFFQQAADKDPDDKVIQGNLEKAKQQLQYQQEEQRRMEQQKQQDKEDVIKLQGTIQEFTKTLNASPTSGSLDFDSQNSKTRASDLQFGDPSVVDARNPPSGLPAEVDNAIPHTPVGENVRKGFEAIQAHDWNTALGWFKTALIKEPNDPGLMRLVDLAQYTLQRQNKAASGEPGDKTGLNGALNDYNQNFLSKHSELKGTNLSDAKFLKQEDPVWVPLFRYITSKLPKQAPPNPAHAAALGKRG